MKTKFSVVSFFDPYGDGKSTRKVFKREFFESDLPQDQILEFFLKQNEKANYYSEKIISFKNYKKTKPFIL